MAPTPSGSKPKASNSNAFPLAVIVLLAIIMFGSKDAGGDSNSFLRGAKATNNGASAFIFEITPAVQDVKAGDRVDFILHYENHSNRALEDLHFLAALPKGVTFMKEESDDGFSFINKNTAEYFLGFLPPGEKGQLLLVGEVIQGSRGGMAQTNVAASWQIGVSGEQARAVVGSRVAIAETKQERPKSTLASAQTTAAGSRISLVLVGVFLVFLSWYFLSLFTQKKEMPVFFALESTKTNKEQSETLPDAIIKTKGAPPDNLPI